MLNVQICFTIKLKIKLETIIYYSDEIFDGEKMNHIDIQEAKEIYKNGGNITNYLRNKFKEDKNTSDIIEIAYDLQAGSYIDYVEKSLQKSQRYADEIGAILNEHLRIEDSLLDIGTGELTTLTLVLNKIDVTLSAIFAFDISWSRLKKGLEFYRRHNINLSHHVNVFVADMKQIPLNDKSIDVVTSSHALEPNGSDLTLLLSELFRVTKRKLVLFEPSYELNSDEGKKRMDDLGYIKGIEDKVNELGGRVVKIIPISNIDNPLNPTACYIIEPPYGIQSSGVNKTMFCVPGTNLSLQKLNSFLESKETGLVFPVLEEIPVLRSNIAILASAKF